MKKQPQKRHVRSHPSNHLYVFLDMDGVLAAWRREDYAGDDPAYLRLDGHHFANLPASLPAILLAREISGERSCSLCIASGIKENTETDIGREHFYDKMLWLSKNLPGLDIEHIVIAETPKQIAVSAEIGRALGPNDVLVDDYNDNLVAWRTAGGCAVKWLNGKNDPDSYDGYSIDPRTMTPTEMLTQIMRASALATYNSGIEIPLVNPSSRRKR